MGSADRVRFSPGELILHRQFTHETLACVRTARVVAHDDAGLRLWIAHGNPVRDGRMLDGRGIREVPFAEWVQAPKELVETVWSGPDVLVLIPPDAPHAVWWFWNAHGAFDSWYVNLEEPGVGWRDGDVAGIDISDQDLDIVVTPDRRWRWKDLDEFTERLDYPDHYWVRDEAAVWAEGRRMVGLIKAGRFPFDGTWCQWRPDPTWTQPLAMPAGWERPRVR